MKRSLSKVFVAVSFTASLLVSVSFSEDTVHVELGDDACAEGKSCQVVCDEELEQFVKYVKDGAKVGTCYHCCKEVEQRGVVNMNLHPTHDELHQFMLDKCVVQPAMLKPNWLRDFPTDLRKAEAFVPKTGKIGQGVKDKYQQPVGSEPNGGPRNANESACIKGCTYRTQDGMTLAMQHHKECRQKCPANAGTAKCGK